MKQNRLGRILFFAFLLLSVIPLIITSWDSSEIFKRLTVDQIVKDQHARTYLIGKLFNDHFTGMSFAQVDSLCKNLEHSTSTRVTIILPSGKVVGDSDKDPNSMENHGNRPEVLQALSGEIGSADRFSATLHNEMMYMAAPIYQNHIIVAVIRTALPVSVVHHERMVYFRRVVAGAVLIGLICGLISFMLSRWISQPISEMCKGAERFASGDLDSRLHETSFKEMTQLSGALNNMALQLKGRIETITAQRNEIDAILFSMNEGIIAIDKDENIININRAAAAMFNVDEATISRKKIYEALRHSELHGFVANILNGYGPFEVNLTLQARTGSLERDTLLKTRGSTLFDMHGKSIGALITLNDVTLLNKLETIRKEFVANVSHELRTPLTVVKGFVETIINGAINNTEDATRFLGIIGAQIDRLSAIVDDLLLLSSIEKDEETSRAELKPIEPLGVVSAAVLDRTSFAKERSIDIIIESKETCKANINESLLRQAVVNLVDNAIKYSPAGKKVRVLVGSTDNACTISIIDEGIGIAPEHQGRLFERFYRVDKARSRKLGGTGLGLSIVKHIAQLHNGQVHVQSVPEKGSTFTIVLPKA